MAKKILIFILILFLSLPAVESHGAASGAIQVDGHWIGLNWPLIGEGRRSSAYGSRSDPFLGVVRAHGGVDIAAPMGTLVVAALGGRVTKVGNGGDLGKHIYIDHPGGRQTIYGHLSEIKVKLNQFVNPRAVIGKVGSTGRSTGPHLHFAVKRDGKSVDPEKWMVPTGFMKQGKASDGQHWFGIDWPLPIKGVVSSQFGVRTDPFLGISRAHGGVDIAAPTGTNVLASLDGVVLRTGEGGDLGKHVYIDHDDGVITIYGHLSEISVKAKQMVGAGDVIGKVGSTGRSTGPHLHFALKHNNKLIDPQKWTVKDKKKA